jgi:hypothetical protein
MPVRVEAKGPFAVYRFERKSNDRITLELPVIALPTPAKSPPAAVAAQPADQYAVQL